MESQSQTQIPTQTQGNRTSSRKRPVKEDKLCLEDYLDILRSLKTVDLSINLLNQIIYIDGFRKQQTKKVLVDAVNALDLMDLPKSTLSQSMSASATLALDDVIVDLNELGWQECCVTSLYTLSSSPENSPPLDQNPQLTKPLQTSSRTKTSKKSMDANKLSGVLPKASQNGGESQKWRLSARGSMAAMLLTVLRLWIPSCSLLIECVMVRFLKHTPISTHNAIARCCSC